jgi:peptide deformylase
MTLAIAQLGQPVLRRVAEAVPPEAIAAAPFQHFLGEMLRTLQETGGVGLAAPQVFANGRLFLAVVTPPQEGKPVEVEVFINPRLAALSEEQESAWEGCLSFPELQVLVPRHRAVRVEYLDRLGEARALDLEGFAARVVQHEYDHLDGILTIDRAASTRDIVKASELAAAQRERSPETAPKSFIESAGA